MAPERAAAGTVMSAERCCSAALLVTRGWTKKRSPWPQTKMALPTLARLIHSQDEEVLTDACWALSYLSDGTNDKIQEVIQTGVCRRLTELLLCAPAPLVLPLGRWPQRSTLHRVCALSAGVVSSACWEGRTPVRCLPHCQDMSALGIMKYATVAE